MNYPTVNAEHFIFGGYHKKGFIQGSCKEIELPINPVKFHPNASVVQEEYNIKTGS